MTLAPGREAKTTRALPTYARGCKPGHAPLRFRGDGGACFRCGRHEPPRDRLDAEALARLARKGNPKDGWQLLDEAVAQAALKMRALALLEDVDLDSAGEYRGWLKVQESARETLDERLRAYHEGEVRWAMLAAFQ